MIDDASKKQQIYKALVAHKMIGENGEIKDDSKEILKPDDLIIDDLYHDIGRSNAGYTGWVDDFNISDEFHTYWFLYSEDGEPNRKPPLKSIEDNEKSDSDEDFFIRGDKCLKTGKPQKWLVKRWLPKEKSLIQVIGKSGSGKSYLVIDWMLHIVTGQDWNDYKVEQGNVAYLCGEGFSSVNNRIKVWCQEHGGIEANNEALKNRFIRSKSATNLLDVQNIEMLESKLNFYNFHPDLIVIDTLARFFSGNENKAEDANAFIQSCDKLAGKYDCPVVYVHHIGWSVEAQNRGRGSSAFFGAVDYEFTAEQKEEGVLTVSQTKVKDGDVQEPMYLKFESYALDGLVDEDGEEVKSSILIQTDKPESEKSENQTHNEQLVVQAFKDYGTEYCGKFRIAKDKLKQELSGKLSDKNGVVFDGKRLSIELNPNQPRRFINRLIKAKTLFDDSENYFMLIDEKLCSEVKAYQSTFSNQPQSNFNAPNYSVAFS